MNRLTVTPSALRECADLLENAANGIGDSLDELKAKLAQLSLQWQGDAEQAFELAQNRAGGDVDQLRQDLVNIATKVRDVAERYGATDRDAASALGGQ